MANEAKQFTIGGVTHDVMDAGARQLITHLQAAIDAITGGDTTTAIKTFQEVINFLDGVTDDATLIGKLNELRTLIAAKYSKPASGIPASDLANGVIPDVSGFATKTEVNAKANDADVVKGIKDSNGNTLSKSNGIVTLPESQGGLTKEDYSVETQGDGTVNINVADDTYTINLNHTHENMCKLVVCVESELPSTLDPSTIYAITDSGETEIEKLIIRGMEFAGGGVPDTGEPMISSPSNGSTINLGTNEGSGVSKTITVKGKNLTGDLTVAVGTGLTISYGQSTGQSSVTIPMAQALLGAQVTIAYSGTGALDDGSLVISHGGSVLSSVVVVVVAPVALAAVKFTRQQYVSTDIYPGPNTRIEVDMKFDGEFTDLDTNLNSYRFLSCFAEEVSSTPKKVFYSNTGTYAQATDNTSNFDLFVWPESSYVQEVWEIIIPKSNFKNRSTYVYDGANRRCSFLGVSVTTPAKTRTMSSPLIVGGGEKDNNGSKIVLPFGLMNLIIYSIKHYENDVLAHEYLPAVKNGVAGFIETKTNTFITSETSVELVAINS